MPFKVYLGDSRDCTIKDVTLMRNGFAPIRENGKAGYGDGAMGSRNTVIKGNRFFSNYQGGIDLAWTDGVTVSGNTFSRPTGAKPMPPVSVRDSRNVRVGANVP